MGIRPRLSEMCIFIARVHGNAGLFVSMLIAGAVSRDVSQDVNIGAFILSSNKRQQAPVQFPQYDMIYCNSLVCV